MLHKSTVEQATFELLIELMSNPKLNDFALVGGTCLSLRYGHRKSVDLDLFCTQVFENQALLKTLTESYSGFETNSSLNAIGVFGYIKNVKVDFVRHHQFELLKPIDVIEGIRMFSTEDIIAMKIYTILQRGQKKDFWDIAELFKHYSLGDFISFYQAKYPNNQMLISLNYALTYFDDAEISPDPISLNGQTWEGVKQSIRKVVREYLE